MENFVTAIVLQDDIYIFLFNLMTLSQFDQVQKLDFILKNSSVSLADLAVKEVF